MPAPPVFCRLQRGGDPLVTERFADNGEGIAPEDINIEDRFDEAVRAAACD